MKKLLSLVLLFLIGCSSPDPINIDEMFIERDGVYYTKDTNQPYTGPVFILRDNGKVEKEGPLKNGKRNGLWKIYYENGQLEEELTYKNNIIDGPSKYYDYNTGQLEEERTYKNNILDGPYKYYLFENGQHYIIEGTRKDGLIQGPYKIYNEDGKLIEEGIEY